MSNNEPKIVLGVKEGTPKFALGQVVMTQGIAHMGAESEEIQDCLFKHVTGDWGDLSEEDKEMNELGVRDGDRILSAYHLKNNEKIWIITECDRSATTILLPSEY